MATAQQNTAPHTAQAAAASRFNALKHGIYAEQQVMFDETAEDLAELDAEVREQHAPAGARHGSEATPDVQAVRHNPSVPDTYSCCLPVARTHSRR